MNWLDTIPRYRLGHWPTPLEIAPRLTAEVGGPRIWIKRDDCSGLATGGNKTRKLEYLIADAQSTGADTIVSFGAIQSNHARQTAAACARAGLNCHLVLARRVNWPHADYETGGNVLINQLCGAEVHPFDVEAVDKGTDQLIGQLHDEGHKTYLIPAGGSNATGALGYVRCAQELVEQAALCGFALNEVIHASASSGTQAGLVFGFQALGVPVNVLGINVFHPDPGGLNGRVTTLVERMHEHHPDALDSLPDPQKVRVNHAYFGTAYGHPTQATIDAIRMAASLEGLLFDPVYSGKALAALIDQINLGNYDAVDDVVLIHTGGAMSLSVYGDAFKNRD
jgi:L-cysteate sulfo-lyase